jgi:hypothetical protein
LPKLVRASPLALINACHDKAVAARSAPTEKSTQINHGGPIPCINRVCHELVMVTLHALAGLQADLLYSIELLKPNTELGPIIGITSLHPTDRDVYKAAFVTVQRQH